MLNYYIFAFGCVVTVIVGSGLATLIVAHNREIGQSEQQAADATASREVHAIGKG